MNIETKLLFPLSGKAYVFRFIKIYRHKMQISLINFEILSVILYAYGQRPNTYYETRHEKGNLYSHVIKIIDVQVKKIRKSKSEIIESK